MNKFIQWFGTFASISGAWLMPLDMVQLAYICFSLGSGAWLFVGIKDKNYSLITLNLAFFGANCLGLYKVFVL